MLVTLLGAVLLFPTLGVTPAFEVSEGREGVVVNEILSGGGYVLPLRNGEIVPSKPILFHWIGALFAHFAGHYDEFWLRFPSALAALLTLVIVALTVQRLLLSSRQGLLAALLLGTNAGFFQMAQDGRVDMLFTLFVTAAVCRFIVAYYESSESGVRSLERIGSGSWRLIALLIGGAILSKGPLGAVLPLLIIGAIAAADRKFLQLRFFFRWEWLLALLVAAPWYVAAAFVGGKGFLGRQLLFENVSRFVGAEGITTKPPHYYLTILWSEGAPWTVVFGITLLILLLPLRQFAALREPMRDAIREQSERRYLFVAGVVWFLLGVIFFSLSVGKRRAYLLPLFPGLALALTVLLSDCASRIAAWVAEVAAARPHLLPRSIAFIWILILFPLLSVSVLPTASGWALSHGYEDAAITLRSLREAGTLIGVPALIVGLTLLCCGIFSGLYGARNARAGWLAVSFLSLLCLVLALIIPFGTTVKGVTHSYRWFASEVSMKVPAEERISFVKTVRDESFDCFFFYLRRHVRMVDPEVVPTDPGLYIARRRWLVAQSEEFRKRVSERFAGGRRIDTPEELLVVFDLRQANLETVVAPSVVNENTTEQITSSESADLVPKAELPSSEVSSVSESSALDEREAAVSSADSSSSKEDQNDSQGAASSESAEIQEGDKASSSSAAEYLSPDVMVVPAPVASPV